MKNKTYLKLSKVIAEESKAVRLKVGCIIEIHDRILSYGYNGTASGRDNQAEDEEGRTKPEVLHAEFNAIWKCLKEKRRTKGATMYLTHSPCYECAKLIYKADIHTVVFSEYYRDRQPLEFLQECGIITILEPLN